MKKCEYLPICPFFDDTLPVMPAMAQYLKSVYCLRDSDECARFIVRQAVGKEHVPLDLYPDEKERAQKIIATFTHANP